MNTKLTKDQFDLLKTGTVVRVKSGKENNVYYNLPCWFRCNPGENKNLEFEMIFPKDISDNLKNHLDIK